MQWKLNRSLVMAVGVILLITAGIYSIREWHMRHRYMSFVGSLRLFEDKEVKQILNCLLGSEEDVRSFLGPEQFARIVDSRDKQPCIERISKALSLLHEFQVPAEYAPLIDSYKTVLGDMNYTLLSLERSALVRGRLDKKEQELRSIGIAVLNVRHGRQGDIQVAPLNGFIRCATKNSDINDGEQVLAFFENHCRTDKQHGRKADRQFILRMRDQCVLDENADSLNRPVSALDDAQLNRLFSVLAECFQAAQVATVGDDLSKLAKTWSKFSDVGLTIDKKIRNINFIPRLGLLGHLSLAPAIFQMGR